MRPASVGGYSEVASGVVEANRHGAVDLQYPGDAGEIRDDDIGVQFVGVFRGRDAQDMASGGAGGFDARGRILHDEQEIDLRGRRRKTRVRSQDRRVAAVAAASRANRSARRATSTSDTGLAFATRSTTCRY